MLLVTRIGLVALSAGSCLSFGIVQQTCHRLPSHLSSTKDATPANEWYETELVEDDDDLDEDLEWMPDRDKAKMRRQYAKEFYEQEEARKEQSDRVNQLKDEVDDNGKPKGKPVYSEEEENLIQAMGGKSSAPSKREPGYLGDSTLSEIAQDYSVPVCYIADVLCMWGVAVPIDVHDRLGDLVTGEQAFAMLEAIHSLDVAALNDRYSNTNLIDLCDLNGIDIKDGFQMAIKEGWSLPFGVRSVLRVEQEESLLRVLANQ